MVVDLLAPRMVGSKADSASARKVVSSVTITTTTRFTSPLGPRTMLALPPRTPDLRPTRLLSIKLPLVPTAAQLPLAREPRRRVPAPLFHGPPLPEHTPVLPIL